MLKILLATPQRDLFKVLQNELASRQPADFSHAADGHSALEAVRKTAVNLVIVDEDLGDMSGVDLVRRLLGVNALINTVLVSSDAREDFHELTEGLGVLMPLPKSCGAAEADRLIEALRRLGLLTAAG
jgi:DNA-binding response OmpR family regulator